MFYLLRTPAEPWPLMLQGWVLAIMSPMVMSKMGWFSGMGTGFLLQISLLFGLVLYVVVRSATDSYRGGRDIWALVAWRRPSMVLADLLFLMLVLSIGVMGAESVGRFYAQLFRRGSVGGQEILLLLWLIGWVHLLLISRATLQYRLSGYYDEVAFEPLAKRRKPRGMSGSGGRPYARRRDDGVRSGHSMSPHGHATYVPKSPRHG